MGASVAQDGTMTSYVVVRATPPAINWKYMMAQVTNLVTNETYQAQFRENGAFHEARITGLRPNVSHNVIAWAVNAFNIEGAATAPVAFTSDTFSTTPTVPTSLAKISGGTTADANGVVRAYALIRAVPPADYTRKLMAQVKDTTTNAIQQMQLILTGGNYEARFDNLLCNRAHEVIAWAVNFDNVDGGVTAAVAFTSDNYSTAPGAPGTCAAEQRSPRQIRVSWANVNPVAGAPAISYYFLERKVGAGSYAERARVKTTDFVDDSVDIGTAYQYRVSTIDALGNFSNVTASGSVTMAAIIGDSLITTQGVSGTSIADNSINRARQTSSTGSQSGNIAAGAFVSVGGSGYTYAYTPAFHIGNSGSVVGTLALLLTPAFADAFVFYLKNNDGSTQPYEAAWRQVNA